MSKDARVCRQVEETAESIITQEEGGGACYVVSKRSGLVSPPVPDLAAARGVAALADAIAGWGRP